MMNKLLIRLSKIQIGFTGQLKSRLKSIQLIGVVSIVMALVLNTNSSRAALALVSANISIVGDAVNLEFSGRNQWSYDLSRKNNEIHLLVPKVDSAARSKLLSWKGPVIKKIEIKEGIDEKDLIVLSLDGKDVQTFDYQTDQPSRLIVDFFKAEEPLASVVEAKKIIPVEEQAAKKVVNKKSTTQKISQKLPQKGERKPASGELIQQGPDSMSGLTKFNATQQEESNLKFDTNFSGVFDGSDPNFERFNIKDYEIKESSIIASRLNMYIRFPMLTMEDESLRDLLDNKPIYEIKPTDDDENKKARLLLTLFNNKRYAIFLRTVDFFRQAFPKSKYDEIIRYLEADIYFELSKRDNSLTDFQVAMTKYKSLLLDYPDSPLAERTHLLIGYSNLDKNDLLGALSEFQSYLRKYPAADSRFRVKIATADCYRKLNKYDDAEKVLREIELDPSAKEKAIDAAYKRADNEIERKAFDKALQYYSENEKKYPGSRLKYQSAMFNSSESMFWRGEYKKSLDGYREFLQKFPTSTHGGYAMTRIGELLEILGADKSKYIGAYLESIFRYRGSQGAGIANIRLVRERMSEMKPKEIETAIKEIKEFVSKSGLPRILDFQNVMNSDGLYSIGEYDRAKNILISFYRENPTSTNLDVFRKRIVKTITKQIEESVNKNDFMSAFSLYGKNLNDWLKSADRVDLMFYLGKAYESASVPSEASKIYREVLNKLYAIEGTHEEKERNVFENMPTRESLNLRLAAMAEKQNDLPQSGKYLSDIKNPNALNEEERIESVGLWAKVAKAKGDKTAAANFINELVSTWKGKPEKLAPLYIELAQLKSDMKKYDESELAISKVLNLANDTKLIPIDIHAKALELRAETLVAQGKKDEAISVYQELLDQFESQIPLGSVRYKTGKMLFEEGRISDAEKVWTSLSQKPENKLWSQMASEQLAHSKWQDDYKKYINRIPAMAQDKEKK